MSQHTLRTENLWKLIWPIFLQNTTHSLVMLADFWFFSYLSDKTAGVIGQLLPYFWVGAFVIPVFAGTGISVASQYMGAGKQERVIPTYTMNLLLTLSMGIAFSALCVLFADRLGVWIGMTPDLAAIGGEYFEIIGFYFVFMSALVAYNAILSSRGMTHWLMYSAFMIAGINIGLNSLFVFTFDWGVKGIAAASVIGAAAALVLSLVLVHHILRIRFYIKGAFNDMKKVLKPMLRLGISNALEPFSYTIQQIILSAFVVAMGISSMATNSYAGRSQMFQITFAFSLASAAQILMAHWVGSKRFEDVKRLYWKTIGMSTAVAFTYAFLLWMFSDSVLSLFTSSPEIKTLGKSVLFVSIFLEPARAVNIIGGFSLRTVGDSKFPVILGMVFIWGLLPIVFTISLFWTLSLVGLWVCFAIDEIVRAFINMWRWQTGKWQSMGYADD